MVFSHPRFRVSLTTVPRAPQSVPRIPAPRLQQVSGCECPRYLALLSLFQEIPGPRFEQVSGCESPLCIALLAAAHGSTTCGVGARPATDARTYLITVCTGFAFKNSDNAAAKFALQAIGPIYTWITNRTSEALVKKIAALEGGSAAVAVSYGHAAQLLAFTRSTEERTRNSAANSTVWLGGLVLQRR